MLALVRSPGIAVAILVAMVPLINGVSHGAVIPVTNHGFEDPVVPIDGNPTTQGDGDDYILGTPPGWQLFGGAANGHGQLTRQSPNSYFHNRVGPTPDGAGNGQTHWSTGTDSYQVLATTLQPSSTYTLEVDLGKRTDSSFPGGTEIRLGYGTTPGANLLTPDSVSNATPASAGWSLWQNVYTTGPTPLGLGQPLRIELVSGGSQPQFDNVRLSTGAPQTAALDATTQGNWIGVYGADGYALPAFGAGNSDVESLPGYVSSVDLTGSRHSWSSATSDVRALVDPANTGNRKATTAFDGTSFALTVNLDEPQTFLMSFYLLDWDSFSRRQSISVPGYTAVDDGNFHDGHWYQYLVSGGPGNPVTAQFSRLAGANAVLSAITFDPAALEPIPEPSTLLVWSLLAGLGTVAGWRPRGRGARPR